MRGHVKALTSQGRMSAIVVGAMPFAMIAIMFIIDRSFIMPMFTNPLGWLMLGAALVMELIGMFILRTMVRVEP